MDPAALFDDPGILDDGPVVCFGSAAPLLRRGRVAVLRSRSAALPLLGRGGAVAADAGGLADASCAQAAVLAGRSRAATWADCAAAWRVLSPGGRLAVAGSNDAGIAGTLRRLADEIGQAPEPVIARSHARVAVFRRVTAAGPAMPPSSRLQVAGLDLLAPPGGFAAGRLDEGTAILLDLLDDLSPPRRVLDLACGCGPLGLAALARWREATGHLADDDAAAVAATRANAEAHGLAARCTVQWWTAGEALAVGGFDLALVNPPCHVGAVVDAAIGQAVLAAAAAALVPGGRLLAVANRRLPYEAALHRFGMVRQVVQSGGYKVLELVASA